MKSILSKEVWQNGLALFALFFGAGNLMLPPALGVQSGAQWYWVVLGFIITAVLVPMLGIFAHARVQGTLYDLGKKVAPWFSHLFCVIIYLIAITLPSPRTASFTYEMTFAPFFDIDARLCSLFYFVLVFVFVMNRSKILDVIGKYLTPIIALILIFILVKTLFGTSENIPNNYIETPFSLGFTEGYQTFDAIAGVVVGAVILISLNSKGLSSYQEKKRLIYKSGVISGIGLLLIYTGLIFSGAYFSNTISKSLNRPQILSEISSLTLGYFGASFLSVLVALACFTTAVGIVTGTADYFKSVFNNSRKAYIITAVIGCVIGIVLGSYSVAFIIDIAVPVLMLIYPVTIILILLNNVNPKWASPLVFKWVVLTTLLFSIPDFLSVLIQNETLDSVINFIPFGEFQLGWVLPAVVVFVGVNIIRALKNRGV